MFLELRAVLMVFNKYLTARYFHSRESTKSGSVVTKILTLFFVSLNCDDGITIKAPMIYTTPCVMFLMWADTLRGQVGVGWALEMESFLGPVKWHRADRRVPFGAQKKLHKGTLRYIKTFKNWTSAWRV